MRSLIDEPDKHSPTIPRIIRSSDAGTYNYPLANAITNLSSQVQTNALSVIYDEAMRTMKQATTEGDP